MEAGARKFFERYESCFIRALGGDVDNDQIASLYASEFIAASPAGVMTGKNDDQLKQSMLEGYAKYQELRTKRMHMRSLAVSSINDQHRVAHVGWAATYSRADRPDVTIDFDVHYFKS